MNEYYCQKCEKNIDLKNLQKFSLNGKISYLCFKCGQLCFPVNRDKDSSEQASTTFEAIKKNSVFQDSEKYGVVSITAMIILMFGLIFLSKDFFFVKDAEDITDINNFVVFLLNNLNLAFHEAGHLFFQPFGRFMMFLGGSLNQILMPLIITLAFLFYKKDFFGASVTLWWVGENFFNIAPYINDARSLDLVLLGGKTGKEVNEHDWENILDMLNMLHYDYILADYSIMIGKILMGVSLLSGIVVICLILKQRKICKIIS